MVPSPFSLSLNRSILLSHPQVLKQPIFQKMSIILFIQEAHTKLQEKVQKWYCKHLSKSFLTTTKASIKWTPQHLKKQLRSELHSYSVIFWQHYTNSWEKNPAHKKYWKKSPSVLPRRRKCLYLFMSSLILGLSPLI